MADEVVDIDDLLETAVDPNNARVHGERNREIIKKSFERFGPFRSLAMDGDGIIRAGNGSLQGAKDAGITKVRIVEGSEDELIVVKRSDITGEEATAYSLVDNRASDLSFFDVHKLDIQLAEMADVDLDGLGFSDVELVDLELPSFAPEVDPPALNDDFSRNDSKNHKLTVTQAELEKLEVEFARIRGMDGNSKLSEGACLEIMADCYSAHG